MPRTYKSWTKDELKEFLNLWESESTDSLAKKFKVKKATISALASTFRNEGMKLGRKRKIGTTRLLIKEVISEMA